MKLVNARKIFIIFCRLLIFLKINFFKKNLLRNIVTVKNSLDPDQARHYVAPDLGPNCLQRFSADYMLPLARKESRSFYGQYFNKVR